VIAMAPHLDASPAAAGAAQTTAPAPFAPLLSQESFSDLLEEAQGKSIQPTSAKPEELDQPAIHRKEASQENFLDRPNAVAGPSNLLAIAVAVPVAPPVAPDAVDVPTTSHPYAALAANLKAADPAQQDTSPWDLPDAVTAPASASRAFRMEGSPEPLPADPGIGVASEEQTENPTKNDVGILKTAAGNDAAQSVPVQKASIPDPAPLPTQVPAAGAQPRTTEAEATLEIPHAFSTEARPQISFKGNFQKTRKAADEISATVRPARDRSFLPTDLRVGSVQAEVAQPKQNRPVVPAAAPGGPHSEAKSRTVQTMETSPVSENKTSTPTRGAEDHPPLEAAGERTPPEPSPKQAGEASGIAVPIASTKSAIERTDGGTAPKAAVVEAVEPPQAQPVAAVNVARVMEGMRQSEMHIGLRTTAFGSVEVHTVIRENQVGLAVGTERGDLKTFLASEVPTLRNVLHHQDLQLDGIHFLQNQQGLQSDTGRGGNPHAWNARQLWPQSGERAAEPEKPDKPPVEMMNCDSSLNVHA